MSTEPRHLIGSHGLETCAAGRITRRQFTRCCAASGLGLYPALAAAAELGQGGVLPPRPGHHPARAKQLLVLFLTGGVSQVDTFLYRPRLAEAAGKPLVTAQLRDNPSAKLMASPFRFAQHGQSGLWISELFPHLAKLADELCVINTLHTDIVEHFQAALAMHTGSATVPLPSLGSWLSYGLGTLNPNLPSHVVFAEHIPYGGAQVWDSSFLPPVHQGVRIVPGGDPLPNLRPQPRDILLRDLEQAMLDDLNRAHAEARGLDPDLQARGQSFRTARGMMRIAPEVFSVQGETAATLSDYGVTTNDTQSFAWQCLMARRLIESGVRVVELIDSGASNNWDAHGNMQDHRPKAQRVDRPIAALVRDLRRRGLLDDTLIALCTEFGRTPTTVNGQGREHYAAVFSSLLIGGGVKGGTTCGETDEYGMSIVKDPVHVHDYHATILHLLGVDHERLTYRYAGRDFRLTDVSGRVLHEVIL